MMKEKFFRQFKRYEASAAAMGALDALLEYTPRLDVENRRVTCELKLSKRVAASILFEIADGIKAAYELSFVRLYPRYDSALFSAACIDDLIETLCRSTEKIGRGFFDDCTYEYDASAATVTIRLRDGMNAAMLNSDGADRFLHDCVRQAFGLDVRFVLLGEVGDITELEHVEEARRQLSRQYAEAVARTAAPAAERDEPRVEKDKSFAPVEGEPDFEYLNDAKTLVRSGRIVFDLEGAELLYGRAPCLPLRPIRDIRDNASCAFLGRAFMEEERESRDYTKRTIKLYLTDLESSVIARFSIASTEPLDVSKTPAYYLVEGKAGYDPYEGETVVRLQSLSRVKNVIRADGHPTPRVELHLHTNMSAVDALCDPAEVLRVAESRGMPAVAITDHGNVQAYPEVMKARKKYKNVKPLYGMEGYLVDDTARAVFGYRLGTNLALTDTEFVVFDIETTGLSPKTCGITEIGAVVYKNGEVESVFETYVNPGMPIPENIVQLTGITDETVADAPPEAEAVQAFLDFAKDRMLIAHNANFDVGFIRSVCERNGMRFDNTYLDTVSLSRYLNRSLARHTLDSLRDHYKLGAFNHHRASDDTRMLAKIFACMADQLEKDGVKTIDEMLNAMAGSADPKRLRPYHVSILVASAAGLKNLYKMISDSYISYYYRYPRLPKTLIAENRDGLLIGSACEAGELYQAVLDGKPDGELEKIASFYDYFEIMPRCNNQFLIDEKRVGTDQASGMAELERLNRRIVELGEKLGKPVVATGDVHFLDKEDEIYRQILQFGMKFGDAMRETSLYLKTTDEMLEEFSYLGADKAFEVVVTNTRAIADRIDGGIKPIPDGQYTPKIEGAEEELTTCCYDRAREMYGDPLPKLVAERTEKELSSIIKNGFAVLYIIARKLVMNSESQGYLVGSRGSVGSSVIATLCGVSEVNPLPPHYRCPKCRHSEFFTNGEVGSGFDLPPKNCPACGTPMLMDGHDIPFETFLGFHGEKAPDIDLNFSGDNQADAHKYTEVLFGKENIFRAGTVGTIASKTAYGFVKKFLEEKGLTLTKAEENRLISGCVGIKRTTGQHPGGIVVIPKEYQIYDFTPIQHPADKDSSGVITTHFAFEYLHDTLLKLDILGHDVPTFYKVFEDYTGIDIRTVPMNDPEVMELFNSTKPLKPREDTGCELGAHALPEITPYVMQMMQTAKPKTFADLLQISGLSHGTGIWLGNGEELIKNGTCTIKEIIGTRDSIMLYLIQKGVDYSMAFKIMESVRKGKGLTEEMETAMRGSAVPEWYIESCKKIRYMFPKSHAAAYMMGTLRLGWCKVHRPVEYYATYFTVKPEGFDASIAAGGMKAVRKKIVELENSEETNKKDADTLVCLQVIREMFARGYEFLPVDVYKSHAYRFVPENGKIRMPFSALVGLGETAAQNIYDAIRNGRATTLEELKTVASLTKNVVEILRSNDCLGGLPESDQMTLF